jgi:hypothetical protein
MLDKTLVRVCMTADVMTIGPDTPQAQAGALMATTKSAGCWS